MTTYLDNSQSIGNTPLIKLNRILDGAPATVLAKIEGRNPAYSVKCRIGAAMIWDAEKRGLLVGLNFLFACACIATMITRVS